MFKNADFSGALPQTPGLIALVGFQMSKKKRP
jgi:hypothetical protein